MRIWAVSDLHISNFKTGPAPSPASFPNADVCVVAGDVSDDLEKSVQWLADNFAVTMPVLFVPGNHEFYSYPLPARSRLRERFRSYEPRVFVMDRESLELGGTRFVGATFWSDLDLYAFGKPETLEQTKDAVQQASGDCRWIELDEVRRPRLLTPSDMISLHRRDRDWIASVLSAPYPGPTVVITHHAPHNNSVAPQYVGILDTASYASDQTSLIEDTGPDAWIHGHTHHSCSYGVGRTRVYSNQCGHEGEDPGFILHRVIEISGASPAPMQERSLA